MPATRTVPLKARPSRVVPYEQVISLDLRPPAPPPRANASSMAHVLSQTTQPQHPQPHHPYSHPAYQHYPPPTYPYPPPPQPPPPPYGPTYYYRPQQPPVYAPYPPHPPPQPPPPQAAAEPPRPDQSPAQQDLSITAEDPATAAKKRAQLSEDDDTLLIRIALRWIFVREQAASPSTFWIDVTRSFENAIQLRLLRTLQMSVDTSESNDAPTGIVEYSPNVSMDESADVLDETPAESGTGIPDDTAEAQVDVDGSPKTIDAPTAGEAETVPEDTGAAQATEPANEDSPATSISEEG
ncbi:hypothetical protein Q7P36_000570 [Cladosporium allicinum]